MKKNILFLFLFLCTSLLATAQNSVVNITKLPAKGDPSLGNTSVATFLSQNNNLIITSSNANDKVAMARRLPDGQYAIEVTCDVSDRSVNQLRTFTVLIKNTSLKGALSNERPEAGKRHYYQVVEAEHVLTFTVGNTRNLLYKNDRGVSCVEFQVPEKIKGLQVDFSDNIGAKVLPERTEPGLNIITVEVSASQLSKVLNQRRSGTAEISRLQKDIERLNKEIDERVSDPTYDVDANEAKVRTMEDRIEELEKQMPPLYMRLFGDKTNKQALDLDLFANLASPTYRLTISVNDNMSKGEASFDDLLTSARDYWADYTNHTESSYFDAARIAYDKAIDHENCPQNMRDQLWTERNKMADLRKFSYYLERCDSLVKVYTKTEGFQGENVYKYLAGAYKFADQLSTSHPEVTGFAALKEQALLNLQQHPKGQEVVSETQTVHRQTVSGRVSFKKKYLAKPFDQLSVYATNYSLKVKDVPSGRSKLVGKVRADGTYSVVLPDGMNYIFIGGENKNTHRVFGSTLDIVIE